MKSFFSAIFICLFASAQSQSLILSPDLYLPKDTVMRKQLLSDLNGFLSQKEKPNKENGFVLKEDLLQTSVLLDELKEIESNSKQNDPHFYKGYLNNILRQNDTLYKIQFSYSGISNGMPELKALFTLLARKKDSRFYFLSPLKQNTIGWKMQQYSTAHCYYRNNLDSAKANAYFRAVDAYDTKLGAPVLPTEFYCCDNFGEVLQLMGIDYKMDYNGRNYNTLSGTENGINLIMSGTLTSNFTSFDPHDLWHSRLHNVISTSIINKPVDEGTAYLYGGSWGMSWEEILSKFKTYAAANPNADWLALYNESKNFDDKAKYPLNVDFVINALIVRKIEKEKGFSAVIELLSCGKQEKGNENYFKALEKITGVKKSGFNKYVWSLINEK